MKKALFALVLTCSLSIVGCFSSSDDGTVLPNPVGPVLESPANPTPTPATVSPVPANIRITLPTTIERGSRYTIRWTGAIPGAESYTIAIVGNNIKFPVPPYMGIRLAWVRIKPGLNSFQVYFSTEFLPGTYQIKFWSSQGEALSAPFLLK